MSKAICEAFPQVNYTWLTKGKGEMFLKEEPKPFNKSVGTNKKRVGRPRVYKCNACKKKDKRIEELEYFIEILKEQNRDLKKKKDIRRT